jgi:hypothetical protein
MICETDGILGCKILPAKENKEGMGMWIGHV